jgi:hypothetical protein
LAQNYGINEEMKNNIRFFIWGDGTLDGSGKASDRLRLSAPQFKKRFLIEDVQSNSSAEFV